MLQLLTEPEAKRARDDIDEKAVEMYLIILQDRKLGRSEGGSKPLHAHLHRCLDTGKLELQRIHVFADRSDDIATERAALNFIRNEYPSASFRLSFCISNKEKAGKDDTISVSSQTSLSTETPLFVCIPVSGELPPAVQKDIGQGFTLTELNDRMKKDKRSFRTATYNLLRTFYKWASTNQARDKDFLLKMMHAVESKRIILDCVHNPSVYPKTCIRPRPSGTSLKEEKANADVVAAFVNKTKPPSMVFVNPLFGTNLNYPGRESAGEYFCREGYRWDRKLRPGATLIKEASTPGPPPVPPRRTTLFALHAAARTNNVEGPGGIRELLANRHDANRYDEDGYAPLHYAAMEGHLNAINALVAGASADVNLKSAQSGDTPLHLAVMMVRPYAVELLCNVSNILILSINAAGKTPVDLCKAKCESEYDVDLRGIHYMIFDRIDELQKIQVRHADGDSPHYKCKQGFDTTCSELLVAIIRQMMAPQSAFGILSIWLVWGGGQAVQLESRDLPERLRRAWEHECGQRVHLELRRKELIGAREESEIALNQTVLHLIVREIRNSFTEGWLVTNRRQGIEMAALLASAADTRSSDSLIDLLPYNSRSEAMDSEQSRVEIVNELRSEISLVLSHDPPVKYNKFLGIARTLPTYGVVPASARIDYLIYEDRLDEHDPCAFIGANEKGLHVYKASRTYYKQYPWDNLFYEKARISQGSYASVCDEVMIQFDYAGRDTFLVYFAEPLPASALFRACEYFRGEGRRGSSLSRR